MPSSAALNTCRTEIQHELDVLRPELEGLRDFHRLNLTPETDSAVVRAITDYERRETHLVETLRVVDDLAGDGYPGMPAREVIQPIFENLQENVATIEAAFAKFVKVPGEAVKGTVEFGKPVPTVPTT